MRKVIFFGLIASLLLAAISFIASSSPDGLERIAEDIGFIEKGELVLFKSPIPDYTFPNIKNEKFATSLAGIAGVLIMFGLTYVIATAIKKR